MVRLAVLMARNIAGNVSSPLSRISISLPATIGASVYASMVGKKDSSPSVIGGILETSGSLPQATMKQPRTAQRAHRTANVIKKNSQSLGKIQDAREQGWRMLSAPSIRGGALSGFGVGQFVGSCGLRKLARGCTGGPRDSGQSAP